MKDDVDPKSRAKELAGDAIEVLRELMLNKGASHEARVKAAIAVLEAAGVLSPFYEE